ncbi:N-acetyltransferase [Persicobacter sp. CCB-QB2]|uniref:GNAT family N-acetyltransferase n=1 Tax=Persicobacter sp. CCB-QB2 TaxID=1561025 RepID=UPI0006A950C5|nr:GNAT family N-acetyltransferase [Persicobacter sp. CCB-QB2]
MVDRHQLVKVLSDAFEGNPSIDLVVGEGSGARERLECLMEYSLKLCEKRGKVITNEEGTAVLLALHSRQKIPWFQQLKLDLVFAFQVLGWKRIYPVLKREILIKSLHPKSAYWHLWFIGVAPNYQGKGEGAALIQKLFAENLEALPVFLETSVPRNLPLYKRFGFEVIQKMNTGFPLYIMKAANEKKEHCSLDS